GTAKQKTLSDRRAVSLALGVIAFVVLVAALLLRSCEPAHPAMDGGTAGAYGAGPLRDARAGARAKHNHQITQSRNHQILSPGLKIRPAARICGEYNQRSPIYDFIASRIYCRPSGPCRVRAYAAPGAEPRGHAADRHARAARP